MTDNNVAVFGGVDLTDTETLRKQMAETADVGARGAEGVSYMSFSGKKGRYKIGVEGREPGAKEPFLVAIPLFKMGYICWKNGKPIAKRLAGLRDPQITEPSADELGPFEKDGEGWFRGRSMAARSLENGEEIEFSINSKSGVAVIADLHKQVTEKMASSDAFWPVVVFGSEEFEAGGYKNDKPTMDVIAWLTRDDIMKWNSDDFDPMTLLDGEKEEAPAPKRRSL